MASITQLNPEPKKPVFLLDAMSFIFRAYHAMQRQRPMSTRKGVPTAATYVFINMLRKLLAARQLDPAAETVIINSGDGLKTLDAVASAVPAVTPIRASLAAFAELESRRSRQESQRSRQAGTA